MIKAIIVDDEELAISRLEKLLCMTGEVEVCAAYTDPTEAFKDYTRINAEASFLDIEMPEISGMELAERLVEMNRNIGIVFVTAYNEYAVEAFELCAVDYILKPFSKDRMNNTIKRLLKSNIMISDKEMINIKCMGGFKVFYNSNGKENVIRFRTSKAEEMLAFLAFHQGRWLTADCIIENLWSDFDIDKALINLRTTIYYLRQALKPFGTDNIILSSKNGYSIDTQKVCCDFYELEDILNKNDSSVSEMKAAVSLYQGRLMQGRDYMWAEGRCMDIEHKYEKMLLNLSKVYFKEKKYMDCLEILGEAIKIDPLSDAISEKMICTFLMLGDKPNAVRYYLKYKKLLFDELGIEPGEEIKRLVPDIR